VYVECRRSIQSMYKLEQENIFTQAQVVEGRERREERGGKTAMHTNFRKSEEKVHKEFRRKFLTKIQLWRTTVSAFCLKQNIDTGNLLKTRKKRDRNL